MDFRTTDWYLKKIAFSVFMKMTQAPCKQLAYKLIKFYFIICKMPPVLVKPTHGNNSICKAVLGVMTDASTKY